MKTLKITSAVILFMMAAALPVRAEDSMHYRTHEVAAYTLEDQELLLKVAQAEAGNQGEDGMWLVMSVIINRTKDPDFPDSIRDVVYQTMVTKKGIKIYQFSSVGDGRIDDQTVISAETLEALQRINSGDVAKGVIAFEVKDSSALDKYFWYAFTHKDHKFYTKGD